MKSDRKYYRVTLGKRSAYAEQCHREGFVGAEVNGLDMDLSGSLPEDWKAFNRQFIPVYLEYHPEKSRLSGGAVCGRLHTLCKEMKIGDIVVAVRGDKSYYVGEVTSDYHYAPGGILPHRRSVAWRSRVIEKNEVSEPLLSSLYSGGMITDITRHADELERLLTDGSQQELVAADETVEDPAVFALEKHLEDFLAHNWAHTELGRRYDILTEDEEIVGQQFPTDTGPIDLLAISKDHTELLVVELKKGRASDTVVGQIQRYMGYVAVELAEPGQTVRGVIIAMEDDLRLRRALQAAPNIEFYRYEVRFDLIPVGI